ncbi:MAG TPA: DUF6754 domain-containing protein [Candidatus Dormibacteraeota bacterium]|nr:DUF6754 domain-containing protein [Candidatus Dormibacteraeota bacterium]
MPNLGELLGTLVGLIGSQFAASSLRLGPAPSIAIFLVVLVLLSLVARPATRWTTRDLGRLAMVPRAMALAAESGAAAAFSLGSAGVSRATSAFDRLQTLAALPVLGHVARTAARAGVPLRVTANDAVAVHLAEVTLDDAHRATETPERGERSRAEYVGEGRPVAAAVALTDAAWPAAAFVAGGLAEESLLMLQATADDADWTSAGTGAPSQAGSVLLSGDGALIGPELYQAPSDLRASGHDRTGVLASNRLILAVIGLVLVGSFAAVAAGVDLAGALAGR